MPHDVFEEVRSKILKLDAFFLGSFDATGAAGRSIDLKMFTAMQMLT